MSAKRPLLASLLIDTLSDLERSLNGLNSEDAERQPPNTSSISQIVAHVAHWLDSWVNASLGGLPRNHYLANIWAPHWVTLAPRWQDVQPASSEVLDRARGVLSQISNYKLDQGSLYEGSQADLQGEEVTGNYRICHVCRPHLLPHRGHNHDSGYVGP